MYNGGLLPRVSALVLVIASLVLPAVAVAHAAADGVVVIDVPASYRVDPRGVALVGETASHGVVAWQEQDSTEPGWGSYDLRLVRADGSSAGAGGQVRYVFGDRLVQAVTMWDKSVSSRLLPEGTWESLPLPQGLTPVAVTGNGLLVSSFDAPVLSLLPWSGGEPLAITGMPDGFRAAYIGSPGSAGDASGAVVRVYASDHSGAYHQLYVDTSAQRAWLLPEEGACDARQGTAWALGAETMVWRSGDQDFLCTLARPSVAQPEVGTAQGRRGPQMPPSSSPEGISLVPVGQDVVVSMVTAGSVAADRAMPVVVVHPDGSTASLIDWGHHVIASRAGTVLLVGGPSPSDVAVRRVDVATGAVETVAPVDRVRAYTAAVAVDEGRVLRLEDNTVDTGGMVVHEFELDTAAGTLGDPVTVSSEVTSGLAAAGGVTAWTNDGAWVIRDAGGRVISQRLAGNTSVPGGIEAVSGPFIMFGGGAVLDSRTNDYRRLEPWEPRSGRALVNGVVYTRGLSALGGPGGSVLARDQETRRATAIPVPGCADISSVQAAGPWLLVVCKLTDGDGARLLLDTTSTEQPVLLSPPQGSADLRLGNGFLVSQLGDGALEWASADSPDSWYTLAGPGPVPGFRVSTGRTPAVTWTDRHRTRVALLPVTTRPTPPAAFDVAQPSAPAVDVEPTNRTLTVNWTDPPAAEQVTGFYVTLDGYSARRLGPTDRSVTYSGLTNGTNHAVGVTAVNIAGTATTTAVSEPLGPPPAPTNLEATVDPVTLQVHVTWDWSGAPTTESAGQFEIWIAQPMASVPGDVRSATFTMPDAAAGPVTVYAHGPRQSSPGGQSASMVFPGPDTTPPTVRLRSIPQVSLRSSVPLSVMAADDRKVDHSQLRYRSASFGARLGSWRRLPAGTTRFTGMAPGSTYCFSARAVDAAGNLSPWTASKCTTTPVDDRALTRHGRWTSAAGKQYFRGTATRSTSGRGALAAGAGRADAVWIIATTCPTCGKVNVFFDQHGYFKTVSLRSAVRRDRVLVRIPWYEATTGQVSIRRASSNGVVSVDGLALRAY